MKKYLVILAFILLGCADNMKRMKFLEKENPGCKVEPSNHK